MKRWTGTDDGEPSGRFSESGRTGRAGSRQASLLHGSCRCCASEDKRMPCGPANRRAWSSPCLLLHYLTGLPLGWRWPDVMPCHAVKAVSPPSLPTELSCGDHQHAMGRGGLAVRQRQAGQASFVLAAACMQDEHGGQLDGGASAGISDGLLHSTHTDCGS
jgi:hypothetical protein